jgi:hypothetical protein
LPFAPFQASASSAIFDQPVITCTNGIPHSLSLRLVLATIKRT